MNKLKKVFLVVAILVVVGIIGWLAVDYYLHWKGEKQVEMLAKSLEKYQQDLFDKKAADKIGGKTPQETLQMFIGAVEKGDYELASKYFVIDRQEQWKNDLSTAKNVNELINDLKKALNSKGYYSSDKKSYSIHSPLLVSFILYPSGNWKLEEI